jgi:hypothetical protein
MATYQNEHYQPNQLIKLAWKWFCEVHESSLSPLAFKVGYRLYKYIMHLASEQTTIIGDYFQFPYLKEDLASDLGVSPSAFRQKSKKYNGMTVWQELESVGFIIENGTKGTPTIFGVPLFPTEPTKPIKVGVFYKNWIGEEKWLSYINNLRERLNGTFEQRTKRNWKEIDFSKENINNFKIYPKDKEQQKETKLRYQIFCLMTKHGFNVQEQQEVVFKLFSSIKKFYTTRYGEMNYMVLQKAIFSVYFKEQMNNLQKLYAYLLATIQDEYLLNAAAACGLSLKDQDKFREQLQNERYQKRFDQWIKKKMRQIEKELKSGCVNNIEFLKALLDEYYLQPWDNPTYEQFLKKKMAEAEREERQKQEKEEQWYQEMSLKEFLNTADPNRANVDYETILIDTKKGDMKHDVPSIA